MEEYYELDSRTQGFTFWLDQCNMQDLHSYLLPVRHIYLFYGWRLSGYRQQPQRCCTMTCTRYADSIAAGEEGYRLLHMVHELGA